MDVVLCVWKTVAMCVSVCERGCLCTGVEKGVHMCYCIWQKMYVLILKRMCEWRVGRVCVEDVSMQPLSIFSSLCRN